MSKFVNEIKVICKKIKVKNTDKMKKTFDL